jgi:hypothetical protein
MSRARPVRRPTDSGGLAWVAAFDEEDPLEGSGEEYDRDAWGDRSSRADVGVGISRCATEPMIRFGKSGPPAPGATTAAAGLCGAGVILRSLVDFWISASPTGTLEGTRRLVGCWSSSGLGSVRGSRANEATLARCRRTTQWADP